MSVVCVRDVSLVSEQGVVQVRDTIWPFVYKNWVWCSLDQR